MNPFVTGLRIFCAILKNHPEETVMRPSIANLLGTDDILQADFDAERYIAREAEKVAVWQNMTRSYYLY